MTSQLAENALKQRCTCQGSTSELAENTLSQGDTCQGSTSVVPQVLYTVLAFTVLILNRHPERPLSEPALSPAGE
jgi:hypothetical protein